MTTHREPGVPQSLVCFGGVIAIVIFGLLWLNVDLHTLLIIGLIWTAGHASSLGFGFASLKTAMSGGIEKGLAAIYIFVLIGVLIAALIAGGTVASLIHYGVDLLSPGIFLPAGLLLCSLMSLATGTAWGTIGTIGVVLMGLGEALEIPLPLVAGMVVSGASFGDKMSPVSDTTNLAAMSAETDLYAHIKSMLYTTGPSCLLALVAFTVVGLQYADQSLSVQNLVALKEALASEFAIGVTALLPLVVLLVLSVRRVPAELSMLASVGVAVVLAVTVQGQGIVTVLNSLNTGYVSSTGLEQVDTLLTPRWRPEHDVDAVTRAHRAGARRPARPGRIRARPCEWSAGSNQAVRYADDDHDRGRGRRQHEHGRGVPLHHLRGADFQGIV